MKPLHVSEPASLELADAVRWYEERRPGWGARLFDAVVRAFEFIERHPDIGSPRRGRPFPRQLAVRGFPYVVVYRIVVYRIREADVTGGRTGADTGPSRRTHPRAFRRDGASTQLARAVERRAQKLVMTVPSSERLAIRYEELRARVLHGHDRALHGVAVVLRQGLPVWMTLVRRGDRRWWCRGVRDAGIPTPFLSPTRDGPQRVARGVHESVDRRRARRPGGVMTAVTHRNVAVTHLRRKAFLYVSQSTLRQVTENQESTRRQYALRERATALGWTPEQIIVVDCDLGVAGASADRVGFQQLVAEVGMGRVGIVLGLELSRLARHFDRLASLVGDLRPHPDAHPRRGWALRSQRVQRSSLARTERHMIRSGVAPAAGTDAGGPSREGSSR